MFFITALIVLFASLAHSEDLSHYVNSLAPMAQENLSGMDLLKKMRTYAQSASCRDLFRTLNTEHESAPILNRVILRPATIDDLNRYIEIASNKALQIESNLKFKSSQLRDSFLYYLNHDNHYSKLSMFAVVSSLPQDSGKVLGFISSVETKRGRRNQKVRTPEITGTTTLDLRMHDIYFGGDLDPSYWGQGLMYEALGLFFKQMSSKSNNGILFWSYVGDSVWRMQNLLKKHEFDEMSDECSVDCYERSSPRKEKRRMYLKWIPSHTTDISSFEEY